MNISFAQYISEIDFLSYFDKEILPKKGGGRDHMSPSSYRKTFINEIEWLKEKCISGDYKFSPYQEKLILKGKNKLPRVLSIPIVRDRFVLSILSGYLNDVIGLQHEAPNRYIFQVLKYIQENDNKSISYFKTDIASFYDNINHSVLIKQLSNKIDGSALKLVLGAIITPTVSNTVDINQINTIGVPQGLSISNILAAVYMEDCHKTLKKSFDGSLFLRYVDDILVLTSGTFDINERIISHISRFNLGLKLSEEKTKFGQISEDSFDYIGYHINGSKISIKKSNRDKFTNRIVRRCYQAKLQYVDKLLRPRFITDESEFYEYTEADLNLMISGFRVANHNYGWIAYFQQITDLSILYQIDALIKKSIGKDLLEKLRIISIVRTYFDIKHNDGRSILVDFDKISNRGERIAYLKKFGYYKKIESEDISDEEVDRRFSKMVQDFIRKSEMDIRELS